MWLACHQDDGVWLIIVARLVVFELMMLEACGCVIVVVLVVIIVCDVIMLWFCLYCWCLVVEFIAWSVAGYWWWWSCGGRAVWSWMVVSLSCCVAMWHGSLLWSVTVVGWCYVVIGLVSLGDDDLIRCVMNGGWYGYSFWGLVLVFLWWCVACGGWLWWLIVECLWWLIV